MSAHKCTPTGFLRADQAASSSLVSTELRLAPVVLGVHYGCLLVGLIRCVARPARALVWLPLSALNVAYLHEHDRPSVGMVPVSVASLGLVPAAVTTALFGAWFVRIRSVYSMRAVHKSHAVVIVLGGAIKDGKPCRTLANRLNAAATLWHKDPSITLILTGGPVLGEGKTEAECMADWLCAKGVQQTSLVLEEQARNTRENIRNSVKLARRRGLDGQLCVLSSDYHLYRAVAQGREAGVDLLPIPAKTPFPSRLQQWCREVLTIMAKA